MIRAPTEHLIRSGHSAVAAAALLVLAACAPPRAATTTDDLQPAGLGNPALAGLFVGCWALAWELEGGVAESRLAIVPDSVSLRDGVVFGSRERLVSPATHPSGRESAGTSAAPPWESRFRVNRWWVEEDSLRMRFSDGDRDEWLVSLGLVGSELSGRAEHASGGRRDPSPRALVRGRRIGCDFG